MQTLILAAVFVLVLVGLFTLLVVGFLRIFHPSVYRQRRFRYAPAVFCLLALLGMALRNIGNGRWIEGTTSSGLASAGGVLMGAGSVMLLSLFFTLPVGGLIRLVLRRLLPGLSEAEQLQVRAVPGDAPPPPPAQPPSGHPERQTLPAGEREAHAEDDSTRLPPAAPLVLTAQKSDSLLLLRRRRILQSAALALPAAGLGLGALGVASAFEATRVVPRPMRFAGLAPSLHGLRVLQLTDLHIGAFMTPKGVSELVERAKLAEPDLVVLTGDLCDHVPWLLESLRHIERIAPRLGTFAVFGNHEYYRGALEARRIYAQTNIELLHQSHQNLRIGDASLSVVGIDDPVGSRRDASYFEAAADRALSAAPSDTFQLALSHRPKGFDALAARGVALTLSGHTHGAQMGIAERSLLEPAMKEHYLWGQYQRGQSQLYTSSGGGHWFAFRLACPSEAALITLLPATSG